MSKTALERAVRDQLRAPLASGGCALTAAQCEIAPFMGKPPPRCGNIFVGVYSGGRSNNPKGVNAGLDEDYSIWVAISMRASHVPWDRTGPNLVAAIDGNLRLGVLSDAIRLVVARDYNSGLIRARANAIILALANEIDAGTTDVAGFSTGLQFIGEADPEPCGSQWFGAEIGDPNAGVVLRQKFGKANRVQSWIGGRLVT